MCQVLKSTAIETMVYTSNAYKFIKSDQQILNKIEWVKLLHKNRSLSSKYISKTSCK